MRTPERAATEKEPEEEVEVGGDLEFLIVGADLGHDFPADEKRGMRRREALEEMRGYKIARCIVAEDDPGPAVGHEIHVAVHKIHFRVAERVGHPRKHIIIGQEIVAVDHSDYIARGL